MSFVDILNKYSWEVEKESIYNKTKQDVINALCSGKRSLEDFKALISPSAESYLEDMAQLSREITQKRFGRTIQLYIPLYLSNECHNICTYCGFSFDNKIERITLTEEQITNEIKSIKSYGYDHLLFVTGEWNRIVGLEYLLNALKIARPCFSNISMEIQPLKQEEYEHLIEYGLNTVYIYQETYHKEHYQKYHVKGKKSNFNFRLETPDRLGKANIHKIGLGILLGLEDWRTDSLFTALHLQYLEKTYWQTKYSISFPRLRPAAGGFVPEFVISNRELVQLICAYRLYNDEVELSLSTRESEHFRDHVMQLGITNMSAGSKTYPGGYSINKYTLEQFQISDERSPEEIADMIKRNGYEVVWKDWDAVYDIKTVAK